MRLAAFCLPVALGATLAACGDVELPRYKDGKADQTSRLKTVAQLECPESEGDLTRVRVEADGACVYAGPQGAEVTLRLVQLQNGDTDAALKPFETELRALLPRAAAAAAAQPAPPTPPAAPDAPAAPEAAGEPKENVDVSLPGIRIKTEGDAAVVRLPGIEIEADERKASGGSDSAKVNISVGNKRVVVNARDEASEIRTVQLGSDVQTNYIVTDERGSEAGWRLAGYLAAGPKAGPLVVAVLKSKAADGDHDEAFKDAKDLIERNVGNLR